MKKPTIYRADPAKFLAADGEVCRALEALHACAPDDSADPQAKIEHRDCVNMLVDVRTYLLTLNAGQEEKK